MIESNDSGLVWSFFNDRIGLRLSEDFRGVMHIPEEFREVPRSMDHVAVAIAYNSWAGRLCFMHTIVQRPELVTRRIIRDCFEYAFNASGCEAVMAAVELNNERIMNVVERLGFQRLATIPSGGLEGDLVLLIMYRAGCPWLRPH